MSMSALRYFVEDLVRRQLIAITHPGFPYKGQGIIEYASQLPNVLYAGFDPTSNSFHIGNLLVLTALIRSSMFGCSPIALIGEATVAIGDPSGHVEDRNTLPKEQIRKNVSALREQLELVFVNAGSLYGKSLDFQILNNIDWYNNVTMLDYLVFSKRFRINSMLKNGPVRNRLKNENTLSYTEFSYQILQANDWSWLAEKHNCYCQIGGSDQLGNFELGFEHIRDQNERSSLAICLPLLADEKGDKLGKTTTIQTGTGFWLNSSKTSPFAFYQYFRQLHDDIAVNYLHRFSLRPFEEVKALVKKHNENVGKWIAQTDLAEELTSIVHGQDGLQLAKKCSDLLFNGSLQQLEQLEPNAIKNIFGEASTYCIPRNSIKTFGELAETTRPGGTKLMKTGALKINGIRCQDPEQIINIDSLLIQNQFSLVCWGKRKFSLVLWS